MLVRLKSPKHWKHVLLNFFNITCARFVLNLTIIEMGIEDGTSTLKTLQRGVHREEVAYSHSPDSDVPEIFYCKTCDQSWESKDEWETHTLRSTK